MEEKNNDSSFIFGLVIGAVIAAVVAVYIYKHKKSAVFQNLKEKLENYFADFTESRPKKSPKKSVTLPKNIEVVDLTPPKAKKPTKMFKKK